MKRARPDNMDDLFAGTRWHANYREDDTSQAAALARVREKIARNIMDFHNERPGAQFHVEDLRRYVLARVPNIAPDSPGRILRSLRQDRLLDYVVINRRQSLYQFRKVR